VGFAGTDVAIGPQRAAFCEHAAAYLLSVGELAQAQQLLCGALTIVSRGSNRNACVNAGLLALLGEVHRRSGALTQARACLARAAEIQQACRLDGDLADFTLPVLAKLESEPAPRMNYLNRAVRIQESHGDYRGLVQSLLPMSRLTRDLEFGESCRTRIVAMRQPLLGLRNCPLLGIILENWTRWVRDDSIPSTTDAFWGL
jgi:hypothetical protein